MRLRITVLACALTALASAAAPTLAAAHPIHNRGLTIHALPHRIIAGEPALILGRLHGPDHAGQRIQLFHRINPDRGYSLIGTTTTNTYGEYEFTRAEGIVLTNRSWFVRGPGFTHSRTTYERVAALVSLSADSTAGLTRHPITFTGHVTPDHAGDRILLQQQRGSGDDWRTIGRTVIGAGSDFSISHAWRVPGDYNVRAVFRGDARNTRAASDAASVVIQQTQVPDFTIQTSDPIVSNGSPVTISGTLYEPGTTTGEPSTSVSLFATVPGTHRFRELTTTTTGSGGGYSFAGVSSTRNQLYAVRTTFRPIRHTAVVFEGVQDVVTMQFSSQSSTVGGHITFSGTVSPDKSGHAVYLQKLGKDGDWHTVEVRDVHGASTFHFGWTFGTAGTKQFRARVTGGRINVGGASAPISIDVSQPPLTSLPNR